MRVVHHLLRQLLVFVLILGSILLLCAVLLLDRAPLLSSTGQLNASVMRAGQQWLQQLNASFQQSGEQVVLQANTDELNAAFAMASRTLAGFQGKTVLSEQGMTVLLTMPVPLFGDCCYTNSEILIKPATGPLQVEKIQVGNLRLPGKVALQLLSLLADRLWGPGQGAALLAKVRSVTVDDDAVRVEIARDEQFSMRDLKQQGLQLYRQFFSSEKQRALINHYYQLAQQQTPIILQTHLGSGGKNAVSLVHYLQLLMREAAARSATQTDPQAVVRENQAVLLALGQLFGGQNLQALVNEVRPWPDGRLPRVTLGRRPDLQQHFIYSAAIHLLTSQQLSSAVGEAKELLDSLQGGSGFSFVDLLADRAGIRFAKLATGSVQSAAAVQQFFVSQERSEAEIFPSKSRLPEGLPHQIFEQEYQSVDSAVYRQMVAEIDRRLAALPFYQLPASQSGSKPD